MLEFSLNLRYHVKNLRLRMFWARRILLGNEEHDSIESCLKNVLSTPETNIHRNHLVWKLKWGKRILIQLKGL